jgi:uncharacterized protein (TIGR00725 family)
MSATFDLDCVRNVLRDASGRELDAARRCWREPADGNVSAAPDASAAPVTASTASASARVQKLELLGAVAWLQRDSGTPVRVPVGVIGPRDATPTQLDTALRVGELLADCGLAVVCGGRHGVMQAVCEGVARNGGVSIGLLPDADPALANPYVTLALATGIGEARNALIARSALCLVAIGDSYGTLSEVALGRHFGKRVIGLEGAAQVDGVVHVRTPQEAVEQVARVVLALD